LRSFAVKQVCARTSRFSASRYASENEEQTTHGCKAALQERSEEMTGLANAALAPLEAEATALVEAIRRSVTLVHTDHGQGSGVVWNREGLIITNDHVVAGERAEIETKEGRRFAATVIGRDRRNDLAALRIGAFDLPPAPLGDSTALRVGELLIAVGNPFGVRGAATLGIVSAMGNATWMGKARRELLQADVTLAPGNSGGPLADTSGRVVGIASMVISPGIALAIPCHVAQRFVQGLRG
jgi:serine protease Do